ncbi:translation initiation factor IF-2 [Peptococcus simiae]|uniref:translation initiation factor IF-2 n=1 Tax=Peptococcus simiae TaxID=1643805 RepID=UPI00398036FE
MGKVRIYELAKELKQDSKTIIQELEKMQVPVKNHMSTVSESVAQDIKHKFSHEAKSTAPSNKTADKNKTHKGAKGNPSSQTSHQEKKGQAGGDAGHHHKKDGQKTEHKHQSNGQAKSNHVDQKKGEKSHNQKNVNKKQKQQNRPNDNRSSHQNNHSNKNDKNGHSRNQSFNKKNRKGKKDKRHNKRAPQHEPREFAEVKHHVVINETITVQDLARQLSKKASEIIMKLMSLGMMATMNQELDADTASIIAEEYGATVEVKTTMEEDLLKELEVEDNPHDLRKRPSVVTIMGHVDHGKTSLLDKIRQTNVTTQEAGGITQQIGAYQVRFNNERITFLDTPGHEAFTSMRARGAQITDIAILVVAADDGVMPQTIEAIDHAKAAEVPIIVAINKIDKPDANPEVVKQELTQYGIVAEEWGGDAIMVPVSAKRGDGIEELLEMILLVAEMEDLKANPNRHAVGKVVESKLDKSRGVVATLLVQNGTLHSGDFVIAGSTQGRIRAMFDYNGKPLEKAGPSTPAEILGLSEVPEAGDDFAAVANEKLAKQLAEKRQQEKHMKEISRGSAVSLEELFSQIQEGDVRELNIVLKADTQGSIEAMRQSLEGLGTEEVRVNIIRTAVGGIRESDVMLAMASQAVIIGFNVRPDINAKKLADKENVDINTYRIIYEAIDDIKNALSGLLAPEIREVDLGQAEVRSVFKVPKIGNVAGCYVTDGKIVRNANIRILRDSVVIYDGEMASLKRFKDDVKEVAAGYECGIGLEKFNDIKEGDVFEAYTFEEIKRELS